MRGERRDEDEGDENVPSVLPVLTFCSLGRMLVKENPLPVHRKVKV
jgi:hypothetical protein